MSEKPTAYVHKNKKVKFTGMAAKSDNPKMPDRFLVEIKPFDMPDDDDSYNTWVPLDELYDIIPIDQVLNMDEDDE